MKKLFLSLVGILAISSSALAQGFGIWASKEGVEPITHTPIFTVPRDQFPTWAKPLTFNAEKVQVNAVVGWNTELSTATAGWSLTAHWGITFAGVGFSGVIRDYQWRDLVTHIRLTVGVQF
jgi:hypothetical protein